MHSAGSLAQPGTSVSLKAETAAAFDEYIRSVEEELEVALQAGTPAMWLDEGNRKSRLRRGQVLIEKAGSVPEIPAGLIHEWIGAVFISGVEIAAVVDLLTDYDRHRLVYPEVVDSRLLSREAGTVSGFLRLKKKKFLLWSSTPSTNLGFVFSPQIATMYCPAAHVLSRSPRQALPTNEISR